MRISRIVLLVLLPFTWSFRPSAAADDPPKPVKMTAAEDHKRMMDLLGIKELRRGADGNPKS